MTSIAIALTQCISRSGRGCRRRGAEGMSVAAFRGSVGRTREAHTDGVVGRQGGCVAAVEGLELVQLLRGEVQDLDILAEEGHGVDGDGDGAREEPEMAA